MPTLKEVLAQAKKDSEDYLKKSMSSQKQKEADRFLDKHIKTTPGQHIDIIKLREE